MSTVSGPSDLTADWFSEILGVPVADVALEPITGGVMARAQRATLTFDGDAGDAPASVIVKYQTDDPGSLGVAQAMNLYQTEVAFYRDVAPLVTASVPACHLAEHDGASGNFVLVLEDLAPKAAPGDALTLLDAGQVAAVLTELVGIQAPTWDNPAVLNLEWLSDNRLTIGMFDQFPLGIDSFVTRFRDRLDDEHIRLFEAVVPQSGAWARSWAAPSVVQHGDLRTDNVMFGRTDADPPVTVLDFQTVRLGPPGVDVAYFIGASLSSEDRRAHDEALLRDYHAQLLDAGVRDLSFDACWQSYREGALYGVCLFVGMAGGVESTERADQVIAEQIARFASMAIDLESAAAAGL